MIRRVAVRGYKSLKEVDLVLRPLTVIVGPNAVGKSNLFDALHLLSRIVSSRSLAEAFEEHRGDPLEAFDCSEGGLSRLLQKEEARFTIEVDVELNEETVARAERAIQAYRLGDEGTESPGKVSERLLRYGITVAIVPRTGVLRVLDERLEALVEAEEGRLQPNKRRSPFVERVGERLRLRMEGQARPREYEVGLSYALASQPVHPPHYPHLVAFREEVSQWQFYYFEPRSMREESPVKSVRHPSRFGGDLAAFYYTLQNTNPLQFDNIQRVLRSIVPTLEGIVVELTQEGKIRLSVREGGVNFSAKVVSEGTLRLLGVLAVLSPSNPATLVSFEEPENGVHPRRLKLVAELLRNASRHRQVLLNTHSPLLPDYLTNAHIVRCWKQANATVLEPVANDLFRQARVGTALEGSEVENASVSRYLLRGDWEG